MGIADTLVYCSGTVFGSLLTERVGRRGLRLQSYFRRPTTPLQDFGSGDFNRLVKMVSLLRFHTRRRCASLPAFVPHMGCLTKGLN